MPPFSRDTAPDLTPETLQQAAAGSEHGPATEPSHGGLGAPSPTPPTTPPTMSGTTATTAPAPREHGEPTARSAPPAERGASPTRHGEPAELSAIRPSAAPLLEPLATSIDLPPMTQGGTQISTFDAEQRRALLGAAQPASTDRSRFLQDPGTPPSSKKLEEQLRRIEHRLDQLDARMRLLEKGLERSGAASRAGLLWWGFVLLAAIAWGLFQGR